MMRKSLLVLAVLVFASVSASAGPVFLTPAQLASFTLGPTTGPAPLGLTNLTLGGYAINWPLTASGAVTATAERTGLALGGVGDTFDLTVTNNNGSLWNFEARINLGPPILGPVALAPGGSFTFQFVLPAGGLTAVQVRVSQTLPIGAQQDRGAEFRLSQPVPEPTSMLLLGTGLLGVAGLARRRYRGRS